VGWEKVVCWSTKAEMSLKRVQNRGKLLWRAYRKSPTLFPTAQSPTPYGLLLSKIGVSDYQPKLRSVLSQERVKLPTSSLTRTIKEAIRTKCQNPMKKISEKGAWAYPGTVQIFMGTPYYLRNGKSCGFQIWPVH